MGIITLSRQHGSGGEELGKKLSSKIGFEIISRKEVEGRLIEIAGEDAPRKIAGERAPGIIERLMVDSRVWKGFLVESILSFAVRGRVLIIGRGAFEILKDNPGVLHILVTGDRKARGRHISASQDIPLLDAQREMDKVDGERSGFLSYYFGVSWPSPASFHLSINPLLLGIESAIGAVDAFMDSLDLAGRYDAAGKKKIEKRLAIAKGRNRIVLAAGIDPDLFSLEVITDGVMGIRFFGVPAELRERSVEALQKLLRGYEVRLTNEHG